MGIGSFIRYIIFVIVILFTVPSIFTFFELPIEQYGIFVLWFIALITFYTFLQTND